MAEDAPEVVELNISLEKVCYIIVKAREFDAKVEPVEPDPGSDAVDDGESAVLEDCADDPTLAELRSAIAGLNENEVVDLIALAWLGRGDFDPAEWDDARALAASVTRNARRAISPACRRSAIISRKVSTSSDTPARTSRSAGSKRQSPPSRDRPTTLRSHASSPAMRR